MSKRDIILQAAVEEALVKGYENFTRDGTAERAGVAAGSVNTHFKDMAQLRRAVMYEAIQHRYVDILAQGLAEGCNVARNAPDDLKREALETLL